VNWKSKALLQQFFSHVPGGEKLNFFFQRYVTRGTPRPDSEVPKCARWAQQHIAAAHRFGATPVAAATFFEFGAGMDLLGPLLFYALGAPRQIVIDLRRLVRAWLVNRAIDQVRRFGDSFGGLSTRSRRLMNVDDVRRLEHQYGIEYRAPVDARATGLPAESIDHVTSTNTLEHVAAPDILAIHRESFRLLKPNGLATHEIDYQDHYSYFDSRTSPFNYLRYSDRTWSLYNPALMYQNRLRHRDHLALLRQAGFEIVDEGRRDGTASDQRAIARMRLAERFRSYSPDELAVRTAFVVARKPR
jgi:hypothetical protein